MSISSINNLNIAPIIPSLDLAKPADIEAEFQEAFNSLNIDRIIDLLSNGANPNQKIHISKEFARSVISLEIMNYSYNQLLDAGVFESERIAAMKEAGLDESLIKRVALIQQDLERGEPVSIEVLREVLLEYFFCGVENGVLEDAVPLTPVFIALRIGSLPLMEKLVESGVDVTNFQLFKESLNYLEYEGVLIEKAEASGLNISFLILQTVESSVQERIKALEELLTSNGIEFPSRCDESAPFDFAAIENLSEKQIAVIDFLLVKGASLESLFSLDLDSFRDLIAVENHVSVIEFIEKRGFDVVKFFNQIDPETGKTNFHSIISGLMNIVSCVVYDRTVDVSIFVLELIKKNPEYFEKGLNEGLEDQLCEYFIKHHVNIENVGVEILQEKLRKALEKPSVSSLEEPVMLGLDDTV